MIVDHPVLLTRCKTAAGTWPAAVLLYRLCYWTKHAKVTRNGFVWVAKSSVEWRKETGLTEKEYKNAVKTLKSKLLIATEKHFYGQSTPTHMRLTDRGLMVRSAPTGPTGQAPGGPTGEAPEGPTNNKGDNIKEIHKGNYQEVITTANENAGQEEYGKEDDVSSVKDVQKMVLTGAGKKKPAKTNLGVIWQTEVHEATNKFVPVLTMAQQGQLKLIMKACPEGTAPQVLRRVIRNWGEFASQVMTNKGHKQAPMEPLVGYVLAHVGEAIAFAKNKSKPAPKKGLVSPKKAAILPQPVVQLNSHDQKATPAELAEILQSDE